MEKVLLKSIEQLSRLDAQRITDGIENQILQQASDEYEMAPERIDAYISDEINAAINAMSEMIKAQSKPGADIYNISCIYVWNKERKAALERFRASIKQPASTLPPELIPPQLLPILDRGQKAGFLDNEYKPIRGNMTRFQQKRFALLACIEAGLDNYCSRFGQMWKYDYNRVDEVRGAVQKREAINCLFQPEVIDKAKIK